MTFLRTAPGIENRGLFFGQAVTVYVEMSADTDPSKALDIAFWTEFFRFYYPGVRVTFSPLGGKHHVINAAMNIVRKNIKNAACAMDTDYDKHTNRIIDDYRVFYTHGYGVENDIINQYSIEKIIKFLAPGLPFADERSVTVWDYIKSTVASSRCCVVSDFIGTSAGCSTLDRIDPIRDIDHKTRTLPVKIRKKEVLKRIKSLKLTRSGPFRSTLKNVTTGDVHSHLYYEICYHTVTRFLSAFSRVKISKAHYTSVCTASIDGVFNRVQGEARAHYETMAGRELIYDSNNTNL